MSGDCDLCGSYDHVETKCDAGKPDDPTAPRMLIQAVPESVDRHRLVAMFAELGIDLRDVTSHGGVWLGVDAIRCTVLARDANGDPYLDETGLEIATHSVCILVKDRP